MSKADLGSVAASKLITTVKTLKLCFCVNKLLHILLYAVLLYARLWRNLCTFTLSAVFVSSPLTQ